MFLLFVLSAALSMIPVAISMDFGVWTLVSRITLVDMLTFIGIFCVIYVTLLCIASVSKGIYTVFLGPILGHSIDLAKMGQWAVVTGATDGIGKAYAEELAKIGMNIVLISRNPDKLIDVAANIREDFKVATRIIAVDFTHGPEIYNIIKAKLEGLQIGVLVNNVGMSYSYPELITELPDGDQFVLDLINCNCVSCTMMCRIVLPVMLKRNQGVILNLSSGASLAPFPMLSVYSASKIFIDRLSQALSFEYRNTNLIIQSVVPFYVTTKMSKRRASTMLVPTPKDYVRSQLKTVGLEIRTYGFLTHKLLGWLAEMVLHYLHLFHWIIFSVLFSVMKGRRDSYLRNKQKFSKKE